MKISIGIQKISILIASVLLYSQFALAERLPVDYFAKHSDYLDVKISPDAKHFAVRFRQDDRIVLAFIRRSDMQIVGGARPLQDGDIINFYWVNNERVIYEIAQHFGGLDFPVPLGLIFGVNADGKRHSAIYSKGLAVKMKQDYTAYRFVDFLKDDEKHVLVARYPLTMKKGRLSVQEYAYPTLAKLNVYNGRMIKTGGSSLPSASLITDAKGNARAAIAADESANLMVEWRPEPDSDWQPLDLSEHRISSPVPLTFEPDEHHLLFTGQPEEGATALYRMNLLDGGVEQIYKDDASEIITYLNDFDDDQIVAVYTEANEPKYTYLRGVEESRTVRLHKSLCAAFPGDYVRFTSKSRDGKYVVAFVSSSRDPGRYFLFNTETNEAQFLFATSSWVEPDKMRPKLPVKLKARDGLDLYGYLTLPSDDAKNSPMMVLVHGGPHGPRDRYGYDPDVQFLANRGYAVLQINFRGSGGYGEEFMKAGYGEWGGKMQDDVTDATLWAIENGYADKNRVCIGGASYGGYAALMGITKEPDLYKCALSYVGVSDLATMFEQGDVPEGRTGEGYLKKVLGDDMQLLAQRSPAKNADKIKAKVFIAHGGEDVRVPIVHAEMMRDALNAVGNPPEWLVFENEGHGFYKQENVEELYSRLETFLDATIGSEREFNAQVVQDASALQ